jgi:hypothetical protein
VSGGSGAGAAEFCVICVFLDVFLHCNIGCLCQGLHGFGIV